MMKGLLLFAGFFIIPSFISPGTHDILDSGTT